MRSSYLKALGLFLLGVFVPGMVISGAVASETAVPVMAVHAGGAKNAPAEEKLDSYPDSVKKGNNVEQGKEKARSSTQENAGLEDSRQKQGVSEKGQVLPGQSQSQKEQNQQEEKEVSENFFFNFLYYLFYRFNFSFQSS